VAARRASATWLISVTGRTEIFLASMGFNGSLTSTG